MNQLDLKAKNVADAKRGKTLSSNASDFSGADPENSERGSSILDTFYFSETEFYTKNTKFQRKRGGRGPLDPP